MAVCGLSLHPGSSESRKTLEQEFFFRIGTLNLKEAPLWVPRHTTLIAQRIFYLAAHALVILFVGLMDQRYEPKMHAIRLLLDSDLVAYASYSHWQRQQLMFSLCTVVICNGRFLGHRLLHTPEERVDLLYQAEFLKSTSSSILIQK